MRSGCDSPHMRAGCHRRTALSRSSQRAAQVCKRTPSRPQKRKTEIEPNTRSRLACRRPTAARARREKYRIRESSRGSTHLSSLRQRGRESDVRDALVRVSRLESVSHRETQLFMRRESQRRARAGGVFGYEAKGVSQPELPLATLRRRRQGPAGSLDARDEVWFLRAELHSLSGHLS